MNPTDNNRIYILALVLVSFAFLSSLLFGGTTLEDAHITFRYVRNFAEGAGFGVWNAGQAPVEGATSFLWMLILGVGMKAHIGPFLLSKLIGSAAFIGTILLFVWASVRTTATAPKYRFVYLVCAILLAMYAPFAWYSVSGMETTFFSFLVAAMVISMTLEVRGAAWVLVDGLLICFLVLTRPEGMLFGLVLAFSRIVERSGTKVERLTPMAVFAVASVGLVLFRLAHFGDPLPNTYYAKATGDLAQHLIFGFWYVLKFACNTWLMWLVLIAGGLRAWRDRDWTVPELLLVGTLAVYFAYVLKVGGDPVAAFPLWRHFVHIAPLWIFLVAAAVGRLCKNNMRALAITVMIGLVTDATMLALNFSHRNFIAPGYATKPAENPYFDFVNRFADGHSLAAISLAGQWGWYVRDNMIDMLGLNDRHIAHFGTSQKDGEVDSKTDMSYVMQQHPEIIDGFMSGIKLRAGECPHWNELGRRDMLLQMLRYPGFLDDYYFVTNAPYQFVDRALFVSKSIAEKARASGAELVSLRSTVLVSAMCTAQGL